MLARGDEGTAVRRERQARDARLQPFAGSRGQSQFPAARRAYPWLLLFPFVMAKFLDTNWKARSQPEAAAPLDATTRLP
jgi:hypothetical protein